MNFTIYTLSDPYSQMVFYVGVTRCVFDRKRTHLNSSSSGSLKLRAAIDRIKATGEMPIFTELLQCCGIEAHKEEVKAIKRYQAFGYLVNTDYINWDGFCLGPSAYALKMMGL